MMKKLTPKFNTRYYREDCGPSVSEKEKFIKKYPQGTGAFGTSKLRVQKSEVLRCPSAVSKGSTMQQETKSFK